MNKYLLLMIGVCSFFLACTDEASQNEEQNWPADIPKPVGYINDFNNLLDSGEEASLNLLVREHERIFGNEIALVTLTDLGSDTASLDSYSLRMANQWGIGKKDLNNGVLIAVHAPGRSIYIQNGIGITNALTDQETRDIINSIITPRFRNGDFYGGLEAGIIAIQKELTAPIN